MLKELLTNCGLNKTEQVVLLALLERGASVASALSKQTKLKRTTIYAALNNLQQYGLVVRQHRDKITYFAVVSSQLIGEIIEAKAKIKYEAVKQSAAQLPKQLEHFMQSKSYDLAGFEISTIESPEAIYAYLGQSLLSGNFCAFFNPQVGLQDEGKKVVLTFLKQSAKTKPHIREILVAGEMSDFYKSKIENPNHLIKELPGGTAIFSDMILTDGEVLIANYKAKNELSIKIRQKEFFDSMSAVFDTMWGKIT